MRRNICRIEKCRILSGSGTIKLRIKRMEFSPEQKKIIEEYEGQCLVVACPGSGKTTVLLNRIRGMLLHGVKENEAVIITYTKEAAAEMKKRYVRMFGNTRVFFGTIHAMCFSIIRDNKDFKADSVITNKEKSDIISHYSKQLLKQELSAEQIKEILECIGKCKNMDIDFSAHVPSFMRNDKKTYKKLCECYEAEKEEIKKIDFEDMIKDCVTLLLNNPALLEKWRGFSKYILVDEFQDVNTLQAKLIYLLAGRNGNLCCVGDDDQSIYGFRGSNPRIMQAFDKVYPNAKVMYLSTNYRCANSIVKKADNLIHHNTQRLSKQFLAFKTEEGKVTSYGYLSKSGQYKNIASEVKQILESNPEKSIAVLYRNNKQGRLLSQYFKNAGIEHYTTEAEINIHENRIFKDIMAYYRMSQGAYKKYDYVSTLNKPARYLKTQYFANTKPIRKVALKIAREEICTNFAIQGVNHYFDTLEQLKRLSNPTDFVTFLYKNVGYEAWILENLREGEDFESVKLYLDTFKEEAAAHNSFQSWISATENDSENTKKKEKKGVTLTTFHSAKGLEWDNVFIIDANEGITPPQTSDDLEEERRLFYVAMTRAKNNLKISFSLMYAPSSFIEEAEIESEMEIAPNPDDMVCSPEIMT